MDWNLCGWYWLHQQIVTARKQRIFLYKRLRSNFSVTLWIGMNYRLLGYVFDQKRIRGAVWRLVWSGVQDALYELSDALKATVTGKTVTLRRASWECVSGS